MHPACRRWWVAVVCCLFTLSLSACSHTTASIQVSEAQIGQLAQDLTSLSTKVVYREASEASRALLVTTAALHKEYDMKGPALYHNMLVNIGLRERGLCCHWAEDLHAVLRNLKVSSLTFSWLVAHFGSHLREHNTIVIHAQEDSWREGIVFDPWRKAGAPFWTTVKGDKYPWTPHPLGGQWGALRCRFNDLKDQ